MSVVNTINVENNNYTIEPVLKTINGVSVIGDGNIQIVGGAVSTELRSVLVDIFRGSKSFGSSHSFDIDKINYPCILIRLKTSYNIYCELIVSTEYFGNVDGWKVAFDSNMTPYNTSGSYVSHNLHVEICGDGNGNITQMAVNKDKYASYGGAIVYIGGLVYVGN